VTVSLKGRLTLFSYLRIAGANQDTVIEKDIINKSCKGRGLFRQTLPRGFTFCGRCTTTASSLNAARVPLVRAHV
jgi:hypothetical protein